MSEMCQPESPTYLPPIRWKGKQIFSKGGNEQVNLLGVQVRDLCNIGIRMPGTDNINNLFSDGYSHPCSH